MFTRSVFKSFRRSTPKILLRIFYGDMIWNMIALTGHALYDVWRQIRKPSFTSVHTKTIGRRFQKPRLCGSLSKTCVFVACVQTPPSPQKKKKRSLPAFFFFFFEGRGLSRTGYVFGARKSRLHVQWRLQRRKNIRLKRYPDMCGKVAF